MHLVLNFRSTFVNTFEFREQKATKEDLYLELLKISQKYNSLLYVIEFNNEKFKFWINDTHNQN